MFEQEICEMIEAFEKMLIMQRQTLSETETTPWNTKRFQILNELNWICYKNKIQNLVYGNIVKIVQGNEKKNVWQFHLNFKIIYRSNVTPNTKCNIYDAMQILLKEFCWKRRTGIRLFQMKKKDAQCKQKRVLVCV